MSKKGMACNALQQAAQQSVQHSRHFVVAFQVKRAAANDSSSQHAAPAALYLHVLASICEQWYHVVYLSLGYYTNAQHALGQ